MSRFAPYVLFRRGTLHHTALAGLVPERTWSLLDEAERIAAERGELTEALSDELHAAVPLAPAEHRRELLALRRKVHNDRPAPERDAEAVLPPSCVELLARWRDLHAAQRRLLAEVTDTLGAELADGRKTLVDVAGEENFQRGIQLSGGHLHREVRTYVAGGSHGKPSKRRRVERSIVSFAHRVVFKPSPFGSFTELGAQPWHAVAGQRPPGERSRCTRLNIGLLAWMSHHLRHIEHADKLLLIRANNTLTVRDDVVRALSRAMEGTDDVYGTDRLITARNTDLVTLLRGVLADGQVTEHELRRALTDAGLAQDAAKRTVDQLVGAGLCHRGLGLPDQTVRAAGRIAERLREVPGEQAAACAEVFTGLQEIEDAFGPAEADARVDLLAEVTALVERFTRICGVAPPGDEVMRAAMYEEVGAPGTGHGWQASTLDEARADLEIFQRLLPVLDDATVEKIGLYGFFRSRYGAASEVDLIEFYRAFAELDPKTASETMLGVGDEHVAEIHRLRGVFADHVLAASENTENTENLALDREWLRAFVAGLPPTAPAWPSAAYRVQFAGERAVLNGVTTGQGVFFSRFCDLLETTGISGWRLADALREHLAERHPRQTDLTGTLGLNFNLHPRLAPHELLYPGSVSEPGGPRPLGLADLVVRPDDEHRRLVLVSTVDDKPIDLVPMNFLYPAAAPRLYRFLCAFAPTRTYQGGLWHQVEKARPHTRGLPRPRVCLGDVVLDRRTWRFAADDLPDLAGLERQEPDALAGFDRWRRAAGLPRHTFFRVLVPEPAAGERDWLEETRRWAEQARSARLHKPHYFDARDPFLLQVFAQQVGSAAAATVVFQECLPTPEQNPGVAEEFFVELDLTQEGR